MTEARMESREELCRFRENRTIANAVAEIIRGNPKPIQWAMARYDLTEGEARGALYAQASRSTIEKIIRHRNGGWAVLIHIGETVLGHSLEQHLITLQGEQERARKAIEDQQQRISQTASRLSALRARMDS